MKLQCGTYQLDQRIPAIGANIFIYKPFYLNSIKNDDGSYKQCGSHKSIELKVLIWRTIFYIEWYYKAMQLPKKFPEPRRSRYGTKF